MTWFKKNQTLKNQTIKQFPGTLPWATWWPWFAWTTTTPTTVQDARWDCPQNTGHPSLLGTNISPRHVWRWCPFSKVGYVSFAKGTSKMMGFLYHRVIQTTAPALVCEKMYPLRLFGWSTRHSLLELQPPIYVPYCLALPAKHHLSEKRDEQDITSPTDQAGNTKKDLSQSL